MVPGRPPGRAGLGHRLRALEPCWAPPDAVCGSALGTAYSASRARCCRSVRRSAPRHTQPAAQRRPGQPLLDVRGGRRVLVDVPDQIGQPQDGEEPRRVRGRDEHQIVPGLPGLDQGRAAAAAAGRARRPGRSSVRMPARDRAGRSRNRGRRGIRDRQPSARVPGSGDAGSGVLRDRGRPSRHRGTLGIVVTRPRGPAGWWGSGRTAGSWESRPVASSSTGVAS